MRAASCGRKRSRIAPSARRMRSTPRWRTETKDLLRDLIDNSLLVQEGKDEGISVDADVIKRLDEIRIQNNIATMEELEKQIDKSGISFEDFKNNIKNQLLQQEVIRHEVGSKIILSHEEVQKYYEDHKDEFVRPELVTLREIFVSTEGKPDSDTPALRKKAEDLLQRVKNGEDFGELAKHFSDGSTAKQGGDLGQFQRGQLAANIEQSVFGLQRLQTTRRDAHQDRLLDSASGGALLRGPAAGR